MGLPPVIHRELRRGAMRSKTWWIRSAVVLAAIGGWLIALTSGGMIGGAGKSLLIGISMGPILVAAFCGVVTTADCLAREKRERTFELLLLTELHPLEIILQKLIATTAPVITGLIAIAPLSLIAVSVGGVSGADAAAVGLLTVTTALLSAAVGMFISALVRSMFLAMVVTFCVCALFFGSCLVPTIQTSTSVPLIILRLVNPFDLLLVIFGNALANVSFLEVFVIVIVSAAGALFLLFASSIVLRNFGVVAAAAVSVKQFKWAEGLATFGWIVQAPVVLLLSLALQQPLALLAIALFAGSLAKLAVLANSVRVLNVRAWLEVVLTTPLPPKAYILQELLRLSPRMLAALAVCLAAEIVVLVRLPMGYRLYAAAIALFVVIDAFTLVLVGLWNGLRYRNLNEAVSFSLSSVLLAPLGIGGVLLAFGFRTETLAGGLLLWALLCLATDLLTAAAAKWMLAHRLRMTASV
ncbi:MAG TPA: ABC transporter permease [Verrucomicrobiae bacterium]